jgi:hypothetical protein
MASTKIDRSKQPCQCQHGKSIHHVTRVNGVFRSPCNAPNCKCKVFRPAEKS